MIISGSGWSVLVCCCIVKLVNPQSQVVMMIDVNGNPLGLDVSSDTVFNSVKQIGNHILDVVDYTVQVVGCCNQPHHTYM